MHRPTLKRAVNFGRELILTEDLDPVYVALHRAKLPERMLHRVLVGYWCLYHLGAAALLAERQTTDKGFWLILHQAAENAQRTWPRGAERRHWRGQQAIASAQNLAMRWRSPSDWIERLSKLHTFSGVSAAVQINRGFGPWISFKIADMMERVVGSSVDFTDCALGFYAEPAKGALLLREGEVPLQKPPRQVIARAVEEATTALLRELQQFRAPPRRDRSINVQEVETILCKFKSQCGGHYHVGKDSAELREGLFKFAKTSDLAVELLHWAPAPPLEQP